MASDRQRSITPIGLGHSHFTLNLLLLPPSRPHRSPAILAVILVRLILMPLVGIAAVSAGVRSGILDGRDRTLLFVLLLEASTPPAMNLQLIVEVLGSGTRPMGRVLAVAYIVSIVTLTLWISAFLLLITNGAIG